MQDTIGQLNFTHREQTLASIPARLRDLHRLCLDVENQTLPAHGICRQDLPGDLLPKVVGVAPVGRFGAYRCALAQEVRRGKPRDTRTSFGCAAPVAQSGNRGHSTWGAWWLPARLAKTPGVPLALALFWLTADTRPRLSRSCPSPEGGLASQFAHVLAKRGYVRMSHFCPSEA